MEPEDIDFIKKLVLRFISIYPVPPKDFRGYKLTELCIYLTNLCHALCDVSFKKNLSDILETMLTENLLNYAELYDYTVIPFEVSNAYSLTEYGKSQSRLIDDTTIINIVLEVWIKDMTFRRWVIQRLLPFERFSRKDLDAKVKDVMYWFNVNAYGIEAMRRAIFYDDLSFDRLFDFLKRGGFIREYEKDMFKFTKRGRQLIDVGDYEAYEEIIREEKKKEKYRIELSDKLDESSLATAQIQRSLLQTNMWIAVAGVAAAIYYLLEIHLELKDKRPEIYSNIFPFLLTFEMTAITVGILVGIWYFLKKYPKEDNDK